MPTLAWARGGDEGLRGESHRQDGLACSAPSRPPSVLSHSPLSVTATPAIRASAPRSRHPANRGLRDTELLYTIPARKASKKTSHPRGFVKKVGSRVDTSPPVHLECGGSPPMFFSPRRRRKEKAVTSCRTPKWPSECRATLRWHTVCPRQRHGGSAGLLRGRPTSCFSSFRGFAAKSPCRARVGWALSVTPLRRPRRSARNRAPPAYGRFFWPESRARVRTKQRR
jgi:hypothetical protein